MELDSVCGKELSLQLSLNSSPSIIKPDSIGPQKGASDTVQGFEPSLTLGHNHHVVVGHGGDLGVLFRQDSAVISGGGSSFSNKSSAKRERDGGSEESAGRVMSGASVDDVEDDDDCVNGRKKLRLTKPQSALLEEAFKHHSSLNPKQKHELARELKLRPRQVEVWFQNRRARTKLKQTEMNFEHLKKYCEKLSDENRRLHKEVEELKALKISSQPFYMQVPATTLTMCPSCERVADTESSNVMKNPFTMVAKPYFFNSFTNPSPAC